MAKSWHYNKYSLRIWEPAPLLILEEVYHMKTWIIVAVLLLFTPSIGFSSVCIELENGSTFITDRYWESEGQIHFNFSGGTLSVPKGFINAVKKSGLPYIEESDLKRELRAATEPSMRPSELPDDIQQSKSKEDKKEGKKFKKGSAEVDKKLDLEYFKNKNKQLRAQLDASLEELREASHEKDQEAKGKARESIRGISRQIYSLADEVKNNFGALPKDWW